MGEETSVRRLGALSWPGPSGMLTGLGNHGKDLSIHVGHKFCGHLYARFSSYRTVSTPSLL